MSAAFAEYVSMVDVRESHSFVRLPLRDRLEDSVICLERWEVVNEDRVRAVGL